MKRVLLTGLKCFVTDETGDLEACVDKNVYVTASVSPGSFFHVLDLQRHLI